MTWRGLRKVYAFTIGMVCVQWQMLAEVSTPESLVATTTMVLALIGGNVWKAHIDAKNGQ